MSSSKKTDDMNVRELVQMIDFDGKTKLSTKSKSDDPFIPMTAEKVSCFVDIPTLFILGINDQSI